MHEAITMTCSMLRERGADVEADFDTHRTHRPIWPDAIKEALAG